MCSIHFRLGRQKPIGSIPKKWTRSGNNRPDDEVRSVAFLKVVEYLEANDDEQISVQDLIIKMKEYLPSNHDTYTSTHVKTMLEKYFWGQNCVCMPCWQAKCCDFCD